MDDLCSSDEDAIVNVKLTPELEELVQRKVASGLYNNQSEVVREALRLLAEQDRLRETHLERLRTALAEVRKELRKRGRSRTA